MTNRLQGETALISGSARGIGAAIATLFAAEGAAVVLSDMRDDLGESVAAHLVASGADGRVRGQR